jgi:hypothetical protein
MVVSDSVAELHTAPAAWIPSPDKAAIDCIGRVVVAEQAERLEVMFVVLGRDGQARASYREIKLDQLSPAIFLSTTELRERFIERRAELRNVQLEQRTLESNLETLKADADAIAKVSKIVSAEDELERIKGAIKQVSAAYKNIDRLKQQTASRPTPLRAKAREYELTERLQSLSLALSSAETETIKRTASEDLKRKLALIEETREEHIALLEQELAEATKGTARD